MSDVVIAGIGQVAVGEHWERSLRSLAVEAINAARADAGGLKPQALYVGNYLASIQSHQANLGALLADWSALRGIEAYSVESAGASGGAAFRQAYLSVASGYVDCAIAVGVEKFTDLVGSASNSALATALDYDYEAMTGLTPAGVAGLLMQRYMHTYQVPRNVFAAFPVIAHANGAGNPNAMFRKAIKPEAYEAGEMISDRIGLFDMAPYADGAAAVVLTRSDLSVQTQRVVVAGSASAIDTLALHDRKDVLAFNAVAEAVMEACRKAGTAPDQMDFFELADTFSIYAALQLEAAGYAAPGEGWRLASDGRLNLSGDLPICTMGGMKARGNPLGAAGVYQIVESVLQLRGTAGVNQIAAARQGLVVSLGGPASSAVAHVLRVE